MLSEAKLQTIICTTQPSAAETFYRDVLELKAAPGSDGALRYNVGGADLRIFPVTKATPSEHTVVGFAVKDVAATVAAMAAKGIEFVRFEGFAHAASGIFTTPDGSQVAWFRDPDGNLLSVVQYP